MILFLLFEWYNTYIYTYISIAFLFSRIYDVYFTENIVFYVIAGVLTTVLLAMAYANVLLFQQVALSYDRRQAKPPTGSKLKENVLYALQQSNTNSQAASWAYFQNNLVYLIAFFFLQQYVLGQLLPPVYIYVVASTLAGVGAWQFSILFRPSS